MKVSFLVRRTKLANRWSQLGGRLPDGDKLKTKLQEADLYDIEPKYILVRQFAVDITNFLVKRFP